MTKKQVINICQEHLAEKMAIINNALKQTQASSNDDTKSSAGDKHETSRAMAHIENERLAKQLSLLIQQNESLNKINPEIKNTKIALGSFVKTKNINLFISTGYGKIRTKEIEIYAISSNSPVATNLLGKTIGEEFKMGSNTLVVTEII
jgi:transcription elongation GreA/GreB family factor